MWENYAAKITILLWQNNEIIMLQIIVFFKDFLMSILDLRLGLIRA